MHIDFNRRYPKINNEFEGNGSRDIEIVSCPTAEENIRAGNENMYRFKLGGKIVYKDVEWDRGGNRKNKQRLFRMHWDNRQQNIIYVIKVSKWVRIQKNLNNKLKLKLTNSKIIRVDNSKQNKNNIKIIIHIWILYPIKMFKFNCHLKIIKIVFINRL